MSKNKKGSLEDLKQKYMSTKNATGRKILLALIRLQDPKFKG